jgi:uncharacterized protein with PIN domain
MNLDLDQYTRSLTMMITQVDNSYSEVVVVSYATSVLSLKIRARYIDYRVFNYCASCKIKILSKETLRCPECNQKVRFTAWHRGKAMPVKRI